MATNAKKGSLLSQRIALKETPLLNRIMREKYKAWFRLYRRSKRARTTDRNKAFKELIQRLRCKGQLLTCKTLI